MGEGGGGNGKAKAKGRKQERSKKDVPLTICILPSFPPYDFSTNSCIICSLCHAFSCALSPLFSSPTWEAIHCEPVGRSDAIV